MHTVWKAMLQLRDRQEIEMPRGAVGLCAKVQKGVVCVWYHCDPGEPLEKLSIWIVGTGHVAPDPISSVYLGTVLLADDNLVFHVFEVMAPVPRFVADQPQIGAHN